MSKRDNHRVVLTDFLDKKRKEGSIEIETADGQVFTVDPPSLWPDEITQVDDKDNEKVGRLVLGDERFEAFKAAGGSANIMAAIIADVHGASTGE